MGGFSNNYVPLFVIVGFNNKVYYDTNSYNFINALNTAISEMQTEGIYVNQPFEDQIMLFNDELQFDVSGVFGDIEGNPVIVSVENISDPEIVSASVTGNTLTLTAGTTKDGIVTVTLKGTAGEFSATDDFTVKVYDPANFFTEDFETGDFSNMSWESEGNSIWTIDTENQYSGSYCARSGVITHNQKSELTVSVNFPVGGTIQFQHKHSSENGYDNLKFFINDSEKKRWSGIRDWELHSYDVEPGSHTFKWSYEKDGSFTSNEDCAWLDDIEFQGGDVTSIESNVIPEETALLGNYPNPFNPSTEIRFSLASNSEVQINVYNYNGRIVDTVISSRMNAGNHSVEFNASDMSAGVYFYNLVVEGKTYTDKMLLLK